MKKLTNAFLFFFLSLFLFAAAHIFISEKLALPLTLILFAVSLFLSFKRKSTCFVLGALLGSVFVMCFSLFILKPLSGICKDSLHLTVRITDYAEGKASYGEVSGRLISADGKRVLPYKVDIVLNDASPDGFEPGYIYSFYGSLTQTTSASLLEKGFYLKVSELSPGTLTPGKGGISCAAARLSKTLTQRIRALFSEEGASLLSALLCGDRSGLSNDFRASLYKSGLSHTIAVSGMHVSIILGLFISLFGKKAGFILAIPILPFYALMTGSSPSVIRASVMSICLMLAFLLSRDHDGITALLFAAAFIGMLNPFSLCSISFLLSFFATLGILLFSGRISGALRPDIGSPILKKAASFVITTFSVTLSATVFTLPILLLFFNSVSLISVISNILVLWAIAPAMSCGILALAVSYIFPALTGVAVFICSLFLKYILWAVGLLGGKLSVTAPSDNIFFILAAAVLFVLAMLFYRRKLSFKSCASFGAAVFILCFCASFIYSRLVLEINIYGKDGESSIVISDGGSLYAMNLPSSYSADQFLSSMLYKYGKSSFDEAVLAGSGYKTAGNAGLSAMAYSPEGFYGDNVLSYGEGGSITLGSLTAAAVPCGGAFALYFDAGRVSLLDMCALSPADWAIEPFDISCDILIIDESWTSSPRYLSALCSYSKPSLVLISGSSLFEGSLPKDICGCAVAHPGDAEYYRLRVLKK